MATSSDTGLTIDSVANAPPAGIPAGQDTATSTDVPSIDLTGVTKSYDGKTQVLKGVDLTIGKGEFFTLLGPSGCGKTTLLRIIAGLEEATSGSVKIGGVDVTGTPPNKRNVNTVFQSYALFPHLNVRENIGFGLRMRRFTKGDIHQRVEETAQFIKISELLDRRIHQLSGGQQQRVALARALVNAPSVLLLDEPLSALDAGLRSALQIELLKTQRRLGMTFVFVTHDQQEAMVMSDRIAVLNEGSIQQIGSPRHLYEHPANLFVARFMGHSNLYPIREYTPAGVQTDMGRITGRFEPGAYVLIRPEVVSVSEASDHAEDNTLRARVRECVYRGNVTEYRLDCNGTELVAKCTNLGQPAFDVDADVNVTIATGGVVTIRE